MIELRVEGISASMYTFFLLLPQPIVRNKIYISEPFLTGTNV